MSTNEFRLSSRPKPFTLEVRVLSSEKTCSAFSMKVKHFMESSLGSYRTPPLDREINEWLETNKSKIITQ